MLVGALAGAAGAGFAIALSDPDDARIYLGALLAGIGFVYVGFAVSDGRPAAIVTQTISSLVFLQVALVAVHAASELVLGLGFLGHAVWDLVHHEGHGPTRVRSYYPPFCAVADVVIAAAVLSGIAI
jgi:hypothetical protein